MRRTRFDRDRAHHSNVCLEGGGARVCEAFVGMGICGDEGRVIQLSKTQLIATICFARRHGCCDRNEVRSPLASERWAPVRCGMEEVFHGPSWHTIGPVLATGDVVRLRVTVDTSSSQC